MDNIFQTIKQTLSKEQFKDFVTSIYGIEFRGTNAFCPFHDHNHNTPSLGINSGDDGAYFNCFACNTSGDIVKFVALKEQIEPIVAAKKVCDHFNIPNSINAKEMTEADRAAYEEHQRRVQEECKARLAKEAEEKEARAKKLKERLPRTVTALYEQRTSAHEKFRAIVEENFPSCARDSFDRICKEYIGYSIEHKSIAIIIKDEFGNPVNIKYKQKFAWDKEAKALSGERMPGKWIGEAGASAYPFPIREFKIKQDDKLIICEGEKDALNLLALDANVLTLGGVGGSLTPYLDLLKDKEVYIWFDHDEAGYKNAVLRYNEIKDHVKNVKIVLFFSLTKDFQDKKYDITDFIKVHFSKFNASSVYDVISFASFNLTDRVLDDICDYFPNLKEEFEKFRSKPIIRHFDQIFDEILQRDKDGNYINIFNVKGELDEPYINEVLKEAKNVIKKDGKKYDKFKEAYFRGIMFVDDEKEDFEKFCVVFDKLIKINKTVLTNYHQTHITDMVESFESTLNKLGYGLAQYRSKLYFWTKTHYAEINPEILSYFIQEHWMLKACVDKKKTSVKNTLEIIDNMKNKAYPLYLIRREDVRRVVNFKNGTAFISKNGNFTFRHSHDKKDAALNILDFEYDKGAKCPKWDRFLKQVLPDEEDRKALMEFIGYCFLPSHEFESFLFLYGKSGANGKSVILDTIRSFFGEDNVSSLQLQQFEGHKTHALTNKLLNIGSEIDKNGTDKGQLSILKSLVSTNEPVRIDPKNKDGFELTPLEKPKLIFSGNEKPKQGLDNGVFRRMLILVFNGEIKESQRVRNLAERFNDEMAGIFVQAMQGLKRLMIQNKFTRSKRMQEEIEEYKDDVNPMRVFVRDALKADKFCFIPNNYFYAVYKQYISDKGGQPLSLKRFFTALKDELKLDGINISQGRKRVHGSHPGLAEIPRCTFGVRLTDDLEFDSLSFAGATVKIKDMNFLTQIEVKADEEVGDE